MADTIATGGGPNDNYQSSSVGYQPATRTAGEVAAIVRRTFGDESGVQIEDPDLIRWINDAQDTIVNRNRVLKAKSRAYSIVGDPDYQLPDLNILQIESLHYAGQFLPSMPFAQAERVIAGASDDGEPQFWYEWGGSFTFWPSPKTVQPIDLFYSEAATRIAAFTDLLGVPDKYFQAIVQFCLQQAYEQDEDLQVSTNKGQQFDSTLAAFGEEERAAQHMTFGRITMIDDWGW